MLIRNAQVYSGGKLGRMDILIEGRRIAEIGRIDRIEYREEEDVLDAAGLVALPGLIDMHAHFREPGEEWKEDFLSGSRAALAGGFTLVYDMPNNSPKPTITKEALEEKKKLAKKALCEVRFHFGASGENFREVRRARPDSLKIYLGRTTGGLLIGEEDALRHMENFPKGKPVFVHTDAGMAASAVGLARKARRKIHITHAPTLADVEAAKRYTLGSADCTPHHLFLDSGDAEKLGSRGLVKPELQAGEEVAALWSNLGKIEAIATDHAPQTLADKEKGAHGFPGLETALALFLDAHSRKRVPLGWIVSRLAENPARIMGLRGYGEIRKGYVANIVLVDLKREWVVRGSEFHSKSGWTPFEGRKLKGKVVKTICRGKLAFG